MYKYIITFILLMVAARSSGQDLIVTDTGDSLKCKIINITGESVSFRFGNEGNAITMPRGEVVSYKYNFGTGGTKTPAPVQEKTPRKTRATSTGKSGNDADMPSVYVSALLGVNTFGGIKEMDGDRRTKKSNGLAFGVDAAYFINKYLGVGFKFHHSNGKFSTSENKNMSYNDRVLFAGLGIFGRWGDKLIITSNIAIGYMMCKMTDISNDKTMQNKYRFDRDASGGSPGVMFSAGAVYMLTRNIGLGANLYGSAGTVNLDYDYYETNNGIWELEDSYNITRRLSRIGIALSLNINF